MSTGKWQTIIEDLEDMADDYENIHTAIHDIAITPGVKQKADTITKSLADMIQQAKEIKEALLKS